MIKNSVIVIMSLAIIALGIMFYNTSQDVSLLRTEKESLELDLEDLEGQVLTMDELILALKDKVSTLEEELTIASEELASKEARLETMDGLLSGEGSLEERIKSLKAENVEWRDQLNELSMDLNEIQSQEVEEEPVFVEQISDLEAVASTINARMTVLEDAVSNLSKLSVERIMVEQEVGFLGGIVEDIDQIEESMRVE